MLRRPHYIALGLVVLLTLVILNLPSQTTARLKLGIGSLFLPLFGLASSSQQLAGATERRPDAAAGIASGRMTACAGKTSNCASQAMQAEETARENARLRQLVGWQRQTTWKLKLAKVVLREPANWWRTVQIDLGSRDGLQVNLPVLTTEGLVGRVSSVSLTRSQVMLLGDPNCKVSARVENETHDIGVIGASGPLESELRRVGLSVPERQSEARAERGDERRGRDFPRGHSHRQGRGCAAGGLRLRALEARVKLAANLNALEEVWVMFP